MCSDLHAKRLLDLFPSNPASFTQGFPTRKVKSTPSGLKIICEYRNVKRPFNLIDARLHLDGKVRIVANPLLPNGTCKWSAADSDEYYRMRGFLPPEDLRPILNFFPSKSGGVHGFLLLTAPWPAEIVRRKMIEFTKRLGWWPCEINPKQTQLSKEAPHGNGINLPCFGDRVVPETLVPYTMPPEDMWSGNDDTSAEPLQVSSDDSELAEQSNDECGYWWDEPLVAMLEAYQDFFPGFTFRKCGSYYQVPCPGNRQLGGWLDGHEHSDRREPLISDKTVVFIRNGWPKFKCMHAHCDGAYGKKKTINDWRNYFDPGHLFFDIVKWLDDCAEKMQ